LERVLVTGASGPIGTALLASFSPQVQVARLVRGAPRNADEIHWNPMAPLSSADVSGFDAVVHLAGESVVGRWTDAKKKAIRDSRVFGTRHLAAALAQAKHPPRMFICASAVGFYGDRGDEALTESSPSGTGFAAELA
jgi:NAD dependent epimerase/dehydratase family enzyme